MNHWNWQRSFSASVLVLYFFLSCSALAAEPNGDSLDEQVQASLQESSTAPASRRPISQGEWIDRRAEIRDRRNQFLAEVGLSSPDFGWHSPFFKPGPSGTARAMLVVGDQLLLGGSFHSAGPELSRALIAWDGSRWQPFAQVRGDGEEIVPQFIDGLAMFDGDLIATGSFHPVDGQEFNGIARWDGTDWRRLTGPDGTGVQGQSPVINAMAVFENELYIGGRFTTAGGVDALHLARWNGQRWEAVTSLHGDSIDPREISALEVFNGELVIGGLLDWIEDREFDNIVRFNGEHFLELPNENSEFQGLNMWVPQFLNMGDHLAINAGLDGSLMLSWDGLTLSPLCDFPVNRRSIRIDAMVSLDGEIVATGRFPGNLISLPTRQVARWSNCRWLPLMGPEGEHPGLAARAMAVMEGELIIAGGQLGLDHLPATRTARWDGQQWHTLEPDVYTAVGDVLDLIRWRDDLIAAGKFLFAGSHRANHVARFDGERWWPLSGPVDAGVTGGGSTGVHVVHVYDNDLLVGGDFELAGGKPIPYLARFDGQDWWPVGDDLEFPGPVTAITDHQGLLVVSTGEAEEWGSITGRVLAFDGQAWTELGQPGAAGFTGSQPLSLLSYQGDLIAGGAFFTVGGERMTYLARWDGLDWQSLDPGGTGPNDPVHSLLEINGDLVIGGRFRSVDGQSMNSVARYDGQQWHPLPHGSSDQLRFSQVFRLAEFEGHILAAGNFRQAAGQYLGNIARFDGRRWVALAGPDYPGTHGWIHALMIEDDRVLAGGSFGWAGGRPAANLAWFRAEPSNTRIIEAAPGQFFFPPVHYVSATVNGQSSLPLDGIVRFISDRGDECQNGPKTINGVTAYRCLLELEGSGPHRVRAYFSGSSTHADSQSTPVSVFARYPTTTRLMDVSPPDSQQRGEPVTVVASVSAEGSTPTGKVMVFADLDECHFELPQDRCTFYPQHAGTLLIDVAYSGDAKHQSSMDYRIYVVE